MKRFFLFGIPLLLFLAIAVLFLSRLGKNSDALPTALAGRPLPTIELPVLGGADKIALDGLSGPLLINVWGTWCPSCYEEMPYLLELQRKGVRIVGIDYKDETDKAQQFLAERGNPYQQVLADADGAAGIELGVYGAPETFIVDANGVIRDRITGVVTPESFARQAAPVLGVKP